MILSVHDAKSMGLHTSFISADMEKHVHIVICYTYCYILDVLFNWIASVHMFIFLSLDVFFCFCFFFLLKGYPNTVYVMMVPFPLTEPVIIVHPVNRIPFYFVDACLFLFFHASIGVFPS